MTPGKYDDPFARTRHPDLPLLRVTSVPLPLPPARRRASGSRGCCENLCETRTGIRQLDYYFESVASLAKFSHRKNIMSRHVFSARVPSLDASRGKLEDFCRSAPTPPFARCVSARNHFNYRVLTALDQKTFHERSSFLSKLS